MNHGERYVMDYTSHIYDKTIIIISRRTIALANRMWLFQFQEIDIFPRL